MIHRYYQHSSYTASLSGIIDAGPDKRRGVSCQAHESHPLSGSSRNWSTSPTRSSFGMLPLALIPRPMLELPRRFPTLDQRRSTAAQCARCDSSTKPRTRHITSLGSSDNCFTACMIDVSEPRRLRLGCRLGSVESILRLC